jgi:hypothetical protein
MACVLVGREEELATIDRLAAGVHAGGGCLVIRGAAGVGKSALLEAVGEELSGRGWRVLRSDGTPAERRLPFAALHKLLRPIMGQADGLLARQRDALLCAFGLVDGPAPGIFLVALAALDLLAETASSVRTLERRTTLASRTSTGRRSIACASSSRASALAADSRARRRAASTNTPATRSPPESGRP